MLPPSLIIPAISATGAVFTAIRQTERLRFRAKCSSKITGPVPKKVVSAVTAAASAVFRGGYLSGRERIFQGTAPCSPGAASAWRRAPCWICRAEAYTPILPADREAACGTTGGSTAILTGGDIFLNQAGVGGGIYNDIGSQVYKLNQASLGKGGENRASSYAPGIYNNG